MSDEASISTVLKLWKGVNRLLNELLLNMKKSIEYLTPAQVIEKYPDLEQKFGWTAKDIGLFLKNKLVQGHYNHSSRKSMIREDSIRKLIRFANEQIDNQKVTIL